MNPFLPGCFANCRDWASGLESRFFETCNFEPARAIINAMRLGERFSIQLRILLPVLALGLLNIAPVPHQFSDGLREARQSQADGQFQLAAAQLRSALTVQPERSDLWEQIGLAELSAGRDSQAQQALVNARAAGQISVSGQLALGDLAVRQGDYQNALLIWQSLLDEDGPKIEIFQRMARVLEDQQEDARLLAVLRAWHEVDPADAEVAYALGLNLVVVDPTTSLDLLLEADHGDAKYSPAVQVLRRGINQAAVADNTGYGWVMIGRTLGSLDEWHLARRAFEQAVQAAPQYAEAWAFLSEARYQTGDDGETELEKALQINHQSPLVQAITALYWRRQGRNAEALSYLQEVARQEPDEVMWQIELGHTLLDMGDLPSAQTYFERAVALAPNNPLAWLTLARYSIEYDANIQEVGLPAARQASLLAPLDPTPLDLMGLAFLHLGDDVSAERFFLRAIEKDSAYAPAYLHLGQYYLQKNDFARAHSYLSQALTLGKDQPVGETAQRILQRYFQEGG